MPNELLLLALAVGLGLFFTWAFRVLPQERWQIIAAVPVGKADGGAWQGLNLTYYGFFLATANVFAMMVLLVLLGAIGVPGRHVFFLGLATFGLCWPAASLIARIVEKKAYTFTIGGASFVGAVALPGIILLLNRMFAGNSIPLIPTFTAVAIAYAYGEGLGRLACISFGCCYGRRVEQLSPFWQRLLASRSFTFTGAMKKAAYEGGLEGVRVVPIQAITAIALTAIALLGTWLFLQARFALALVLVIAATQGWRYLSEHFRADVRGKAETISAYQVMALLMVGYVVAVAVFAPSGPVAPPVLRAGLQGFWNPAALLLSQILWAVLFLHTGRSKVTGVTLAFHVRRDRI